jgi:hypothetical protein
MKHIFDFVTVLVLSVSLVSGQEILTNESIVKLVNAGLGDDAISGMVNGQPGKYILDTDGVIGLKQAGVSEKVITAMVAKSSGVVRTSEIVPAKEPIVLTDGTPVRLRLNRNISSGDNVTGEQIDFEVLDDVMVGDVLVIGKGSVAIGTITDSDKKKRMGRGGKLNLTIDYVRLVDQQKAALRGIKDTNGGGHVGAMTAGLVASALILWPAAPFFLMMHGKDIAIPKGTEFTAYINGDMNLDKTKFVK